MIFSSFFFLTILTSWVSPEDIKTCYYSRYINYYLKSIRIMMTSSAVGVDGREFTYEECKAFGNDLQTQGEIVLAMLKDLQSNNPTSQPQDLMAINLYLNNVSGPLMIKPIEGQLRSITVFNETTVCQTMFQNIIYKLITSIYHSIQINCPKSVPDYEFDWIKRDEKPLSSDCIELNGLLPEKFIDPIGKGTKEYLIKAMYYLNDSASMIKYIMEKKEKTNNEHESYLYLYPRNALFYDLLTSDKKKRNISADDMHHLELLRNVQVVTTHSGYKTPTMKVLLEKAQFVFDTKYLKSFQRQVLAATAHPVLTFIASYLSLYKYIYYPAEKHYVPEDHSVHISNLGATAVNLLKDFIELDIYPEKVKEYFEMTYQELLDFVKTSEEESIKEKKIRQIFSRCSNPMVLNKLKFIQLDDLRDPKDSNAVILKKIDQLVDNASTVKNYIHTLAKENIKHYYDITKKRNLLFSYEFMFQDDLECDIINSADTLYTDVGPGNSN